MFHAVVNFGTFGIVKAVESADKVSGNTADALKSDAGANKAVMNV